MRPLFWGAAIAGGLYWASKQPGGVSGVMERFQGKLKEVQNSPDPMGTVKQSLSGSSQIETASPYTPLPDHPPAG